MAVSSDLEPAIPFALGGKDSVATAVDTLILRFQYLPGLIFLSSLDRPTFSNPNPSPSIRPSPCSPVLVQSEVLKRKDWGYRNPILMMAAVIGETKLEMLQTTNSAVGNKEGRRGRKTTELNQNQTPG